MPAGPMAKGLADVFICGPNGMTDAVVQSLSELGVPSNQIHAERFALAN